MDFTAIWDRISPYVNATTIAAIIAAVGGVLVKMLGTIKQVKKDSKDLTANIDKAFIKAIPKELSISIKGLVEKELEGMLDKVMPVIKAASEHNTTLIRDIALALSTSKTLPSDIRDSIREHLGEPVKEEKKLLLEINADFKKLVEQSEESDEMPTINSYLE